MPKVIAIDPGGTTGVCVADLSHLVKLDNDTPAPHIDMFNTLEIKDMAGWRTLQDNIIPNTIMLVERWNIFGAHALGLTGSEVPAAQGVGISSYIAHLTHTILILQTPQQKSQVSDDDLKQWFGLSRLPVSPHERDAMRHVVYYMLKERYGRK